MSGTCRADRPSTGDSITKNFNNGDTSFAISLEGRPEWTQAGFVSTNTTPFIIVEVSNIAVSYSKGLRLKSQEVSNESQSSSDIALQEETTL